MFKNFAGNVCTLLAACACTSFYSYQLLSAPATAQLLNDSPPTFDIYCDPNGGGTGQCIRLDDNSAISCQYASQDFIQCQSNLGTLAICVNYAPWQFSCKVRRDARINPDGSCVDSLDASSSCRSPIRKKYTDSLTPNLPSPVLTDPQQPLPGQDDFGSGF